MIRSCAACCPRPKLLGAGRLRHQAELHEQRDLVVVKVSADNPPARVEVPHLAQRQREVPASGREWSERPVMGAGDGEGAYHRLPGVYVAGANDPDAGRSPDPPRQEVVPELLWRPERPALRVI